MVIRKKRDLEKNLAFSDMEKIKAKHAKLEELELENKSRFHVCMVPR
jgi:hypothetical protein